jgi:anti-anti-sigma factor
MNKIIDDQYQVIGDEQGQIKMSGTFRLNGLGEYQVITNLLEQVLAKASSINLDVREIHFLNSSGIAMLSKFIINVRKAENINIVVLGSKTQVWQTKSLTNLKRLMPTLELVME